MNLKYIIAFLSIFPILIIGCTDENQLTNDDLTEIDNINALTETTALRPLWIPER